MLNRSVGLFFILFLLFSSLIQGEPLTKPGFTLIYQSDKNKIPTKYDRYIKINLILTPSRLASREVLLEEVGYMQRKLDPCAIFIWLDRVYLIEGGNEFNFWETFWFNGNKLTNWETHLFGSHFPNENPAIIWVESLNWTLEGQGTLASAYAPFLLEDNLLTSVFEQQFFMKYMKGHSIIGRYRAPWTMLHELAHALFNLPHVSDPGNIMHSGAMAGTPEYDDFILVTPLDPIFNEEQCQTARAKSYFKVRL